MVFSSLTFLFYFLPILIILYFIIKNRSYRNIILLIFSLIFYAWGEPRYIFLMLLIIIISYIFGLLIEKYKKNTKLKKTFFISSLIIIICNLIFFKYTNFIFNNINFIIKSNIKIKEIILPIGISFYTFQILSYLIDLYNGKIKVQKNPFKLALYISLFPQLIAGPIVRYETVEDELSNRKENINDFISGMRRFIIGLSKKVIISNNVALLADLVFNNMHNENFGTIMFWLGALAYTIQIYYDFSGYSDMAIGLGKIFGFNFLENFNYPYISKSITEFWRRWHISLGTWFKDYLYIPLGGNKVSKFRWILNILIVWFVTGLWHGASWNFIIWGLFYGLLLLFEKLFLLKKMTKLNNIVKWMYTFFFIVIGWVIFRIDNFNDISYYLSSLFIIKPTNILEVIKISNESSSIFYLIIGILFSFPIFPIFSKWFKKNFYTEQIYNIICMILLFICICFLVSSNYNPFIYFRF